MRKRMGQALVLIAAIGILAGDGSAQPLWSQEVAQVPPGLKRKLPGRTPTAFDSGEGGTVAKVNNWTVGLAGGLPEGTFLRFAAEIARNVNDPENLRVLAVVTQGATDNVKDLLYLRGIDIAITNADVLEHFKTVERIPNIDKRINFVSEMAISEVHLVVRPEINSIKDLEGKKVSFHIAGAGSSTTAPIVFQALGVKVEPVYINNAIALEKMKTGEIAGARQQRSQAAGPAHQVQERCGLQAAADPVRQVRRILRSGRADLGRLSRLHQARREGRDVRRADRARRLQLATRPTTASGASSASSNITSSGSRDCTSRPTIRSGRA